MRFRGLQVAWIAATSLLLGGNAHADFAFGMPENLGSSLNTAYAELTPSVSSDGLEIYFWSNRPGGFGSWDLWSSTRATLEDDWMPATNLGSKVNSAGIEALPCISADGLELYFSRGSESTAEIVVSRRAARTEPWGTAENLGPVINNPARDDSPMVASDGLELYFVSDRAGGRGLADIWVASRATNDSQWNPPINLSVVNSSSYEQWVTLSENGLTLLFQSTRAGGEYGGLYMSRRRSKKDAWTPPVYLGLPMNGSVYTLLSSLSADGAMLYLSDHINYASRAGGLGSADMWQVPIHAIVDFSGDGVVDGADVIIMAAHWGEDFPSGDIGPTPFGDGVVDIQDLIALADYIGEPLSDPTLAAHWPLDEAEGVIAHDTAGLNHASVVGDATWQPDGGKLGGALRCDGFNDCVRSEFILNPAAQPFSVFVWVKGGAPGQVILSQEFGADGLATDVTGALGTELKGPGRMGQALWSHTVVTDDQWHRVGLVWDGGARILYVDDVKVAVDAQTSLRDSPGGLLIGAGGDLAPGTFWFGPIDEVRVYNRAVKP